MGRCQYCAGLSISGLVRLAQEEFFGHEFPRRAFYQHHPSFNDLEQAAEHGCDLCWLILECFKGSPTDQDPPYVWPDEWHGPKCNIDISMYAAAKELPDSNVRICINSDNAYGSDTIEKVSVFDTLLVQIGPRAPPYDSDDPDAEDWEFPALSLLIDAPREQAFAIEEFRIGRVQLDPDLGSNTNFSIARGWLRSCKHEHAGCRSRGLARLPTRVIDVGTDPEFQDTRLLCSQETEGDYVALSHCWGGRISPLLTSKNLELFQNRLPYEIIPANFQDAIIITRELGIRYLWIDSLCIMQDSPQDWDHESKHMGSVYRDAALTISAMASSRSTQGILRCLSSESLPLPVKLPMRLNDSETGEVMVKRFDKKGEDLNSLDQDSPLSNRGWTLQELLLSPRQLFYGATQIYWRCPAGYKGADGLTAGLRFPDDTFAYKSISSLLISETLLQGNQPQTLDIDVILESYYNLVQLYSHRRLTFNSDKFPAFSGIARQIHSKLGGRSLAGLWTCDIARGLLWRAEMGIVKHVSHYRAPSWSWAVTNHEVDFPSSGERGSLDVQLLSHKIILKDSTNPYGEVRSGSLTLKGLTKTLIRSRQIMYTEARNDSCGTVYFDEDDNKVTGSFDVFKGNRDEKHYLLAVANRYRESQDWGNDVDADTAESYLVLLFQSKVDGHSLVLQRVGSQQSNVYKRVGFFWNLMGPESTESEWDMQTIILK